MNPLLPSKVLPSTNEQSTKSSLQSLIPREQINNESDLRSPITPYNSRDPLIDKNSANGFGKATADIKTVTTDYRELKGLASETIAAEVQSPLKPWRPRWLRRRVIFAFAAWFVAIAAILEPLFSFSQRASGIASSKENLYYLWTFGPTAGEIFLIVGSCLSIAG